MNFWPAHIKIVTQQAPISYTGPWGCGPVIILSHYLFLGPPLFLNLGLVGAQVTHFIGPLIYPPPEMLVAASQPIGPGPPA